MAIYESLQAVFNDTYSGLKAQGFKRSTSRVGNFNSCQYRGDNDRKCAIGHCIPDNLYDPEMEGYTPTHVNSAAEKVFIEVFGPESEETIDRVELGCLQDAHDNGDTPEKMEKLLREFAESFDLTVPEAA